MDWKVVNIKSRPDDETYPIGLLRLLAHKKFIFFPAVPNDEMKIASFEDELERSRTLTWLLFDKKYPLQIAFNLCIFYQKIYHNAIRSHLF